jgi:hypothetical protein
MEEIIRNVRDLPSEQRRAYEMAVGHALDEGQKIIIQIVDAPDGSNGPTGGASARSGDGKLPDWCNVYEGLSDAEIADIEADILDRADLTRPS